MVGIMATTDEATLRMLSARAAGCREHFAEAPARRDH
jgi:hypothetical protein